MAYPIARSTRRRRTFRQSALALVAALGLGFLCAGCGAPVRFPDRPLVAQVTDAGLLRAYDTNGDKRTDYFTTQDAAGRTVRIAYDTTGDGGPDDFLDLDDIPLADCRHVVIVLDGIGYDTVEAFRREGHLRLFHPPSRIISTFPSMTDVAMADVFRSVRSLGFEAVYFDHRTERLAGGSADYLSLKNEAWTRSVDYRANPIWDPISYLYPDAVFGRELGQFQKLFDRRDRSSLVAYFVSTAGLATRCGLEGQRRILDLADRLAERLVWQTRGLVKVTILSDHGHALVRAERIDFQKFLRQKRWRVADRLQNDADVVPIEFGLVTYASFATRRRAALAADLLQHPGVDFVTYEENDSVIVEKPGAKAAIDHRPGRYRYRPLQGDPLGLQPILDPLKSTGGLDADGFVADADLFRLTAAHNYPDPLDRLWRAFHGLTENVPDVIASLKDGYCAGAASRLAWLPYIASTHGDLQRKSSTAFIMSTAGPLLAPTVPAIRSREVPAALERLTGRPWPPIHEGARP